MKELTDPNHTRSGRKPLKQLSQIYLKELGIDSHEVDLREEGIPIPKLNEFVQKIYNLGYQDGYKAYGHAQDELRKFKNEGKQIDKFEKIAKNIGNQGLGTKQTDY